MTHNVIRHHTPVSAIFKHLQTMRHFFLPLCFLFSLVSVARASGFGVHPDTYTFRVDGQRFVYHTRDQSWSDASDTCRRDGGTLACTSELDLISRDLANTFDGIPSVQLWARITCELVTVSRNGCVATERVNQCEIGEPRFPFVCVIRGDDCGCTELPFTTEGCDTFTTENFFTSTETDCFTTDPPLPPVTASLPVRPP